MTYLLDVNVLLALGYEDHVHHQRVWRWVESLQLRYCSDLILATCAITELGFVRIAASAPGRASDVSEACRALTWLKQTAALQVLPDGVSAEQLPSWVTKSKHTTDGHLLQLASAWGATLATLDTRIPGALLIPELPEYTNEVREPQLTYGAAA